MLTLTKMPDGACALIASAGPSRMVCVSSNGNMLVDAGNTYAWNNQNKVYEADGGRLMRFWEEGKIYVAAKTTSPESVEAGTWS